MAVAQGELGKVGRGRVQEAGVEVDMKTQVCGGRPAERRQAKGQAGG